MELSKLRAKVLTLLRKTQSAQKMYSASIEASKSKPNKDKHGASNSIKYDLQHSVVMIWKDVTETLAKSLRHALTLQKGTDLIGYIVYVLDEIQSEYGEIATRSTLDRSVAEAALGRGDYDLLYKISFDLQLNDTKLRALTASQKELQLIVGPFSSKEVKSAQKPLNQMAKTATILNFDFSKKRARDNHQCKEGEILGQVVKYKS